MLVSACSNLTDEVGVGRRTQSVLLRQLEGVVDVQRNCADDFGRERVEHVLWSRWGEVGMMEGNGWQTGRTRRGRG